MSYKSIFCHDCYFPTIFVHIKTSINVLTRKINLLNLCFHKFQILLGEYLVTIQI